MFIEREVLRGGVKSSDINKVTRVTDVVGCASLLLISCVRWVALEVSVGTSLQMSYTDYWHRTLQFETHNLRLGW